MERENEGGHHSDPSPSPSPSTLSKWTKWGAGIATGAYGYVKGALGLDNLEVVKCSEKDEKEQWAGEQRKTLWKRLSELIGKDIVSMISLPVWVFEPLSFLQIMTEPLEFSSILRKASMEDDPVDRIANVAAWNVALYSTAIRTRKPFNPLLGETFEMVSESENYRFLAEQVSHHPPIAVGVQECPQFTLSLETHLKSKFYGNSSEVIIPSTNHLFVRKYGEHYTWGHIITCAHNILVGSLWQDHYGDLEIVNHTLGYRCTLHYTKSGWLGAGRYQVTGEVWDPSGLLKMKLEGRWNEYFRAHRVNEFGELSDDAPKGLWAAPTDYVDEKWKHGSFIRAKMLNISPEYEAILPKTDSRLRTDRRLLQEGDLEGAGPEKYRLEEIQRAEERARLAAHQEWTPRYMKKVFWSEDSFYWTMSDQYWKDREKRLSDYKEMIKNNPAASLSSGMQSLTTSDPQEVEEDNEDLFSSL